MDEVDTAGAAGGPRRFDVQQETRRRPAGPTPHWTIRRPRPRADPARAAD